jgi:hypothetical protein
MGPVPEEKIGKDERPAGADGLGLSHQIPVPPQTSEVASEPLLESAIELAGLAAGKDGRAGRQNERRWSSAKDAACLKVKPRAPTQEWDHFSQGPTIEERPAEDRKRTRQFQHRKAPCRRLMDRTDEAS